MKVSKESFLSIGSDLRIPQSQISAFWSHLETLEDESNSFTKYLFYFGAMIVISAMTWFMNFGWERFGGGGVFLIALTYALIFALVGSILWKKKDLKIPAGLFITMAVCMTPLAIYGLETHFNLWSGQHLGYFYFRPQGSWIFIALATILSGSVALYFFPFPFLTAPIFFAAWLLAIDLPSLIFGKDLNWDQKALVTIFLGLGILLIAFIIDQRKKETFAFWAYFFGTLAFWIGLNTWVWDKSELTLIFYLMLSLSMMVFSVLLRRSVLMIFGAIGVFAYLGHLTHTIFKDSILFPFVLSLVGLSLIYLGILYQKNAKWIETKLPPSIKRFLTKKDE